MMEQNFIIPTDGEKSSSISAIRFLAMCSIIACHFCQYFGSEWAWWLNVGVQVFFIISGFLYGTKQIGEPIGWLKKQFKKILIPYYVFLLFAIIAYAIVAPDEIGSINIISAILTVGTIKGINHLWFVSYILFCYLITPYLKALRDYLNDKSFWHTIITLLVVFSILGIIGIITKCHYRPGYIDCYVLGYYSSVLIKRYGNKVLCWGAWLSLIPCAISNAGYCFLHYTKGLQMTGQLVHVTDYSHMFLAYSVFTLLTLLLVNVRNNKLFQFSDRYSYEIYLVHQLFILSPLTLMTLTNSDIVNVLVAIVLIIISGILLQKCNKYLQSKF